MTLLYGMCLSAAMSSGSENVALANKSKRTKDEIVKNTPLGSNTSNTSGYARLMRKAKLQASRRGSGTGIDNMRRVSSYNRPWAQKVVIWMHKCLIVGTYFIDQCQIRKVGETRKTIVRRISNQSANTMLLMLQKVHFVCHQRLHGILLRFCGYHLQCFPTDAQRSTEKLEFEQQVEKHSFVSHQQNKTHRWISMWICQLGSIMKIKRSLFN